MNVSSIAIKLISLSILLLALNSCSKNKLEKNKNNIKQESADTSCMHFDVKYAKGFKISYFDNYSLVDIQDDTENKSSKHQYALLKKGGSAEGIPVGYTIIETPLKRVVCMTTTQLSPFIKLDAIDKIVGLPNTQYLYNKTVRSRIDNGQIGQIGREGNFENELIMSLSPDLIFVSPYKRGGYETIKNLDIPLFVFAAYKEMTPLGQAEWIKLIAMLIGKEKTADKIFNEMERKYNELKKLTDTIEYRPVILSGEIHSGTWYVPGGASYVAQQIRDAGAEYFLKNNFETGGIPLDFESVYSKGCNAEFWRFLVTHKGEFTYNTIKCNDVRYTDFDAYKNKKVFYCNFRETPFYENAPMEPEVVLADLIKIFHPQLLPHHKSVYYNLLTK